MPILRPFPAWYARPDAASRVACPPYDVVSDEEARRLAAPDSFMRVIRAEVDFEFGADPYDERIYHRARRNLLELIDRGLLVRERAPAMYVYRISAGGHAQTGVIGEASLSEYAAGAIKKHELTRPDKENDRMRHIDATGANTGLVYLTFRAEETIRAIGRKVAGGKPLVTVTAPDQVTHEIWRVPDADTVGKLAAAFAAQPAFYVADGHHRIAASHRLFEERGGSKVAASKPGATPAYEGVMVAAFPHDELRILPYHRLVLDARRGADDVMRAVRERFSVEETDTPQPDRPGAFGMYLYGRWWRLSAPEGAARRSDTDPTAHLDVRVLQERLLSPVFGIDDPRTDKRIEFVGGSRGIDALAARCAKQPGAVALAVPPTSMDDLLAVADAGAIMPPKSTWFDPKLLSGLVVRPI